MVGDGFYTAYISVVKVEYHFDIITWMKNFILTRHEAKIFNSKPEFKKFRLNDELLEPFPHVKEIASMRSNKIIPGSLYNHLNNGIEICYIWEGAYKWQVEDNIYHLLPGDGFITYPWQEHGSPEGAIDIGTISWIIIEPEQFDITNLKLGNWSSLKGDDEENIKKIFLANNQGPSFHHKHLGNIFKSLYTEIVEQRPGFVSMANHLIDELVIFSARQLESKKKNPNDPEKINLVKQEILKRPAHKWLVEEMADILDMKLTSFNHFFKTNTGYSPAQYLLNVRIDLAKERLVSSNSITSIALDCGFYSSQHFSTTFKRRTGLSPGDFRKFGVHDGRLPHFKEKNS